MGNNINVQVYSSCNCDCDFCHFKDRKFQKIDPDFVLRYLEKNPTINYILLTGGEPTFAIDEYKEIVRGIDTKYKRVILQTNGWWGNNDSIKSAIKEFPPSAVHLSVDKQKQKYIPIEVILDALAFLQENNIITYVVNHTNDTHEYDEYRKVFKDLKRGNIITDDGRSLYDCGTALLANNTVGTLDIKGWV